MASDTFATDSQDVHTYRLTAKHPWQAVREHRGSPSLLITNETALVKHSEKFNWLLAPARLYSAINHCLTVPLRVCASA